MHFDHAAFVCAVEEAIVLDPGAQLTRVRGIPYAWPPRGALRLEDTLLSILPGQRVSEVFAISDKTSFNWKLRELLQPYLVGQDRDLATAVGLWIVCEWGGIRKGAEAVGGWVNQLGSFNEDQVHNFISQLRMNRIASWSKLLAFANPADHAIYDARTAVALNCALANIDAPFRFVMPVSRNKHIALARDFLKRGQHQVLKYPECLELLTALAKQSAGGSRLPVEMTVFANAPKVAER